MNFRQVDISESIRFNTPKGGKKKFGSLTFGEEGKRLRIQVPKATIVYELSKFGHICVTVGGDFLSWLRNLDGWVQDRIDTLGLPDLKFRSAVKEYASGTCLQIKVDDDTSVFDCDSKRIRGQNESLLKAGKKCHVIVEVSSVYIMDDDYSGISWKCIEIKMAPADPEEKEEEEPLRKDEYLLLDD